MAINESLIRGAGKAAPKFQKVQLFSESAQRAMSSAIAKRKAERNARDQQISAIVSDLENVDISVTPSEQIEQQYEISGNIRNEVAALAAQRARLPQNSPEAFAIDQQINRKKQMFSQVVANAKDFKELHEEYTKDGGWNMSKGVDPVKQKQLDEIFINKNYTIEYDENGSPTYKTQYGQINQKDLSNYFLKDDEMALTVTNYADDILQNGEKGVKLEGARKDILYRKILNDINAGGPSRLKSLIYDDLVEGQSLGLLEDATAEDAAEAIVNNLINVNNQGLATYQDKQNKLNNEDEAEKLTPGEKQRRASVEAAETELNKIDLGDFETKKDPMRNNVEYRVSTRKRPAEDILRDYNNIIGAQNYKIMAVNGQYYLEPQLPSLSQKERDDFTIKVTDEVRQALGGNNIALNRRLMSDVFKQKPIDRLGTLDDKNLD